MKVRIALSSGTATDTGRVRSENQDSFGVFSLDGARPGEGAQLFVIADGMGGLKGGQEASRIAVDAVADHFSARHVSDVGEALIGAIRYANEAVFRRAIQDEGLRGMGTTCTALAVHDGVGWLGHIGDSRAYRITSQHAEQLTTDHTHVEEMVRLNLITRDEAAVHPNRHALIRCLGVGDQVDVDFSGPFGLREGEWYLLCTDGLSGVDIETVRQTIMASPPQEACDRLVHLANEAGGPDNVTVLILRVVRVLPDNGNRHRWWPFGT